jgi:hypothetical protein
MTSVRGGNDQRLKYFSTLTIALAQSLASLTP